MRILVRIATAVAVATSLLLLPACAPAASSPPPAGLREADVTHVVDGDTIDVRFADDRSETRVRLYGVDTPETTYGKDEPFGDEAAAYARDTLEGRTVWIDTGDEERRDDTSGHRLLAWVWLQPPTERSEAEVRAKMFNAMLLTGGYAEVYRDVQDRTYTGMLFRLEGEANAAGRGIWSRARSQ